jgi:hypothetical protein
VVPWEAEADHGGGLDEGDAATGQHALAVAQHVRHLAIPAVVLHRLVNVVAQHRRQLYPRGFQSYRNVTPLIKQRRTTRKARKTYILYHNHHLSRETSTAGHRPPPKLSTTIDPAVFRDLHQIVGPPFGGPTNAASPGTRSPLEDLSAPTAVSPPRNVPCPLPLRSAIRRAIRLIVNGHVSVP